MVAITTAHALPPPPPAGRLYAGMPPHSSAKYPLFILFLEEADVALKWAGMAGILMAAVLSGGAAAAATTTTTKARPKYPTTHVATTKPAAKPAITPVAPPVVTPLTTDEAIAYTKDLTAKSTAALTDKSLTRAEQIEKFRGVLSDALALDVVGKFVIGDARTKMTPEQASRYDAAFPLYITRQYATQFDQIVGRPLVVKDAAKVATSRTGDVFVRTQFTRTSGNPINVDWRVRKLDDGKLRLVDIAVSGVSIMTVKREEFRGFVQQNGVEPLLARLETDAKKPV